MTRTYCDCCGRDIAQPVEIEGKTYDLDQVNHIEFSNDIEGKIKKLDLCHICKDKIVNFIKNMQNTPDKDWYKI